MTIFRQPLPRLWLILILCILAAVVVLGSIPWSDSYIRVSYQPSEGWTVCADLGVGPVPGLDITRQRFRLCSDTGWEILVYCLQPELPVPPIGTICSEIDPGVFWCGDTVQQLQFYAIAQRPTPATPTPVRTRTATSTITNTVTATARPSGTPANTPTARPTSPRRTANASNTRVPTSVYLPGGGGEGREQAGGETNLVWLVLFITSTGGLIWLQATGLRRLLRKRR